MKQHLTVFLALVAMMAASPADAKPGKGKGKGQRYHISEFSLHYGVRRRGPPDWAPAHGYRAKRAQQARWQRYYREESPYFTEDAWLYRRW